MSTDNWAFGYFAEHLYIEGIDEAAKASDDFPDAHLSEQCYKSRIPANWPPPILPGADSKLESGRFSCYPFTQTTSTTGSPKQI